MNSYMGLLNQDTLLTSILMALIALVGLVGNSLMLRALIQYRQLRTDFYTVFGFLSVVDSLFLFISAPTYIMDMFEVASDSPDTWCKSSNYLMNACGFIAAYLIVVLVVLRGILLTNRNTIRRPQACHLVIVCAVICIVTALCSVPVMFMYTSYGQFCDFVDVSDMGRNIWLLSSFSEFVPLVLVIMIYFATYLLGKRYFADSYSAREKEKSRLVSSIVITFTICQTPYRIATIYQIYTDPEDGDLLNTMYKIKNYLMCLLMIDKAVRPILCTKIASDLCDAFDEVINCVSFSKNYTLTSKYNRPFAAYVPPTSSPSTATALISSTTDNRTMRSTERSVSSSSSTSATSQTPLTRKDKGDDADMCIDIIEES